MTQDEAEKAVPVGTPIVYRGAASPWERVRSAARPWMTAPALSPLLRAGAAEDKELDVDLYILGTTREEVPARAPRWAPGAIAPDFCVAVDVTHGKTPDVPNPRGRGTGAGRRPRRRHRSQYDHLDDPAHDCQGRGRTIFPWQGEVMAGHTGTNGWHMQVSRGGSGHLGGQPAPQIYAYPHRGADPGGHRVGGEAAGRLHGELGKEAETIC